MIGRGTGVTAAVCLLGLVGCSRSGTTERFAQNGIVVSRVFAAAPVAAGTPSEAAVAVYLTIANEGDAPDTLVAVESPAAARAQVHGEMPNGGMTMMMPVAAVPVAGHEVVRLAPAGDTIPLVLVLRRAGRLRVRALVVRYADLQQALGVASAAPVQVPSLRLARSDGGVFDLADERGKVIVVFFGYTHCPDLCPLTLADFAWARRRLGARADRVRFVFVTVDPGRDSPAAAMAYARQFDSSFLGLSGDSAALARVEQAFHVASWVTRDSVGNVLVAHSASVFVVGRDGALARVIPHSEVSVDEITAAVTDALGA